MASFELHHGDALTVLRAMADNSVDAVVTDPPYGLGKEPNAAEVLTDWVTKGFHEVKASGGFMGKKWDSFVPQPLLWKEVFRVLKPGGHLLSFAGTRTYDWMVMSLRLAGFEIRDMVNWVYGAGFPKSLNLNKAFCLCNIESSRAKPYAHKERAISPTEHHLRSMSDADLSATISTQPECGKVLQSSLPEQGPQGAMLRAESEKRHEAGIESSLERWRDPIQEERQLYGRNLYESAGVGQADGEAGRLHNAASADNGADVRTAPITNGSSQPQRPQSKQQSTKQSRIVPKQRNAQKSRVGERCSECGKPVLPKGFDCSRIDGFGTALKPAHEPIVLARKPLSESSIAANVLQWGTGGVNVDGCRISPDDKYLDGLANNAKKIQGGVYGWAKCEKDVRRPPSKLGRFPANLIHDGSAEVVALFPVTTSGSGERRPNGGGNYFKGINAKAANFNGDSGLASRFFKACPPDDAASLFYCAKASRSERDAGLDGMPEKACGMMEDDNYHIKTGSGNSRDTKGRNHHPTVKPQSLMRYLCRLITPPNGTILDPFFGSGSTGVAAITEGFSIIGIEQDAESVEIARRRCEHAKPERKAEAEMPPLFAACEVAA